MPTLTDTTLLHARLQSVHARGRVADVLLGISLDVLEPFANDYLSPEEYLRLCGLVRSSVDAACEAALSTIATELALVADADVEIHRRLRRAAHGRM